MGIQQVHSHTKYLGMPVVFERSKKEVFSFMVERVCKKLKAWEDKALSSAGREVLIKSVVKSILRYIMSCYKLPKECCNHIEKVVARF